MTQEHLREPHRSFSPQEVVTGQEFPLFDSSTKRVFEHQYKCVHGLGGLKIPLRVVAHASRYQGSESTLDKTYARLMVLVSPDDNSLLPADAVGLHLRLTAVPGDEKQYEALGCTDKRDLGLWNIMFYDRFRPVPNESGVEEKSIYLPFNKKELTEVRAKFYLPRTSARTGG